MKAIKTLSCRTHGEVTPTPVKELEPWQVRAGRWYSCPSCENGAMGFLPSDATQQWFADPTAPPGLREAMMTGVTQED